MSRYYSYSPRGLYRSRKGVLAGVCRGLADYFDVSVFWLRMILIAVFIVTGFFPIVFLYILAWLLMKPEPRWRYE